jgi:threonine/homoserine/homoserine lactone efflux protein
VVSAAGVAGGGVIHVLAAAIGLSSLLVSSATAFSLVKYAGAAYLIYLGVRRILDRDTGVLGDAGPRASRSPRVLYRDGFVVNLLNPKTALFFYFVGIAVVSDSLWALAAGSAAGWLRSRPRVVTAERFVAGGIFMGLGAVTLLTDRPLRRA